jgi:hypothetical protein
MSRPPWAVDEAGELNITMNQGKTFRLSGYYAEDIDLTDPYDPQPIGSISLAGLEARAQVRRRPSKDADLVLDLTEYITLEADGDTGRWDIEVGADVTATVESAGWWDLELYDPLDSTEVAVIVAGRVGLTKERTAA